MANTGEPLPDRSLAGKAIVVTGAFGSLGRSVAESVAAAGARVAALDRSDAIHTPKFPLGIRMFGGVDLALAPSAESAFHSIAEELGAIDGLVNIAGGFRWEKLAGGDVGTWDDLYNMNLRTAVNASQAALPFLVKSGAAHGNGRIINLGAAGAIKAGAGMGAYAASKAGVARLTEALAEELKDSGVTVNAIQPSIIDTPANRKNLPSADFERWVTPAQIADVIVFLLSPRSHAITGALIPVTGRV